MCQLLPSVLPYHVDSVLPILLPLCDQLLPRATETQAGYDPTSAWSRLVAWLDGRDAGGCPALPADSPGLLVLAAGVRARATPIRRRGWLLRRRCASLFAIEHLRCTVALFCQAVPHCAGLHRF